MKLTKTIQSVNNNGFKQDIQIEVLFEDNCIEEVIDVQAFNFTNGVFQSVTSIKDFLESQNLMDTLLESINWHELKYQQLVNA